MTTTVIEEAESIATVAWDNSHCRICEQDEVIGMLMQQRLASTGNLGGCPQISRQGLTCPMEVSHE